LQTTSANLEFLLDAKRRTIHFYSADKTSPARPSRGASIHVHPNGRFVYLANRASGTVDFGGKRVSAGVENTIAVFAINRETGEPTLIQSMDTRGTHARSR
jgi:6-phosphogluconolactonase (cycloisomerase 2 family)